MKKIRRIISILISVVMIVSMMAVGSFAENPTQDKNIIILATSDIHGAIEQVRKDSEGKVVETGGTVTQIGFSGLKAYSDALKADPDNAVLLVDNGDAIQGTLLTYLTKGRAIAEIMDAVGYDVIVPGNHDFDYNFRVSDTEPFEVDNFFDYIIGDKNTNNRREKYTSCNLTREGCEKLNDYIVKEFNTGGSTVRVAFVGITTPTTLVTSRPENFKDIDGNIVYDFCNDENGTKLYKRVQEVVNDAEGNADYVIAVGHMGDDGDNPWKSSDVIANTTGIDAFIDGHSHHLFTRDYPNKEKKNVPCIATGTKFEAIGKLIIHTAGIDAGKITIENVMAEAIDSEDESIATLVGQKNKIVEDKKKEPIGTANVELTINGKDGKRAVRKAETNIGDFVADAYKNVTGADVALVNGGSIRTNLKAGPITFGDIFNLHPFGNDICVCKATGQQILDALEMGARLAPQEENGPFLQVAGLTYNIDPEQKSTVIVENNQFVCVDGARKVYNVKINGKDIDPKGMYTVASNDYLIRSGGDGMNMFMNDELVPDVCVIDYEVLRRYIKENLDETIGEQYAEPQGRIVFAKKPVTPQKPVETGDQTNVLPYVLCAAAALILIILLVIIKKKKQ